MILRFTEELGLTDVQVDQIKAVIGSATESIEENRATMQRLQEALRDAVTSDAPDQGIIREIASQIGTAIGEGALIKASVHQSIMAVLTPEQKTQLAELKAERETLRERMEELRAEAEELGLGRDRPEPGEGFGPGQHRGGRN
jgi:Spy/CpxP family protein refolding chaperone